MTDYGGYVSASNGRISEDEAFVLVTVSMYGSDGYPIHKVGSRHWVWGPVRGIKGSPVCFKTRRAAVDSFEAYHSALLDRLAGRV